MTTTGLGIVTCPACSGRKGGVGFVSRTNGCGGPEWIPCTLCRGDGEISRAREVAYQRGRRIWQARQEKDWSLREFAAMLGLKAADASDIENGRSVEEWLRRAEVLVGLREERR